MKGHRAMYCELIRQDLLQRDWTADDLRAAGALLEHLDTCAECRQALKDYDHLRTVLRLPPADPIPTDGWADFEQRLAGRIAHPPRRLGWRAPLALAASIAL